MGLVSNVGGSRVGARAEVACGRETVLRQSGGEAVLARLCAAREALLGLRGGIEAVPVLWEGGFEAALVRLSRVCWLRGGGSCVQLGGAAMAARDRGSGLRVGLGLRFCALPRYLGEPSRCRAQR